MGHSMCIVARAVRAVAHGMPPAIGVLMFGMVMGRGGTWGHVHSGGELRFGRDGGSEGGKGGW